MPIKFVLMVNKQGQTRMSSYFEWHTIQERVALEAEVRIQLHRNLYYSTLIFEKFSYYFFYLQNRNVNFRLYAVVFHAQSYNVHL